jgi:hypothetical protein
VVSRFQDISGEGEGVRHRDISLAGGPRNEISAGDKMSWAGFGGKWGGVSRSSRAQGLRPRTWEPQKVINLKIISKFEIFKQHFQTLNDFKF